MAVQRILVLLKILCISLLAISVSRVLLFVFNLNYFSHIDIFTFLAAFFYGLRFDLSALAIYQAPYILLYWIPLPTKLFKAKRVMLRFLFIFSNLVLISLNCIDSVYFGFTLKRATADFFSFITTGNDIVNLLPQFLMDYWFVPLITGMMVWIAISAYNRIRIPALPTDRGSTQIALYFLSFIIFAGLVVLAVRGGVQLKPIRSLQAAEAVGVKDAPLVLNTPFTIMKTLNKESLRPRAYFEKSKLRSIYNPIRNFSNRENRIQKKNVVIIIMESFSKEYMGPPFGLEGKTPFLDSLAGKGVFFSKAYANGKKSIEGIPAILAGIPSLMEDPYITSVYSNSQIKTLASILAGQGYHTSFFHGGTTGTMGFDAFSKLAGFEFYYGMEDFDGGDSYDGNWGIYDRPFFQFFGNKLNNTPEPFFSTFFSLSSHHPYKIPVQYEDQFKDAKHPLLNTVAYADFALRNFFEQVKDLPWYERTLFVITADHTGQSLNPSYATQLGSFAVPLIFYAPGDTLLNGVRTHATQHIDIQPTVLGYLGYDEPFFSFGKNALENDTTGFAINYLNNVYQFIQGDYVLHFNGEETIGFFNVKKDSLLIHPLKSDTAILSKRNTMEQQTKAVIQTYNEALIDNKLTVETFQK